jgi:hypothetical protein
MTLYGTQSILNLYSEFLFIKNDLFEKHFEYSGCISDFHCLIHLCYCNDVYDFLFKSVELDLSNIDDCCLIILNSNLLESEDFRFQIRCFEQVVFAFFFN